MHPIARKRLRGGWVAPLLTGVAAAVAPNIFEKVFGRGKRRRFGKKYGGISKRRRRGCGELINSGPLP
jgi:hypothetical protein